MKDYGKFILLGGRAGFPL